jgi:predicted nucleic acid-binding protein
MLFVDASGLVKRYVRERGSAQVRTLLATHPIAVSRLSEVEVPSALIRLARDGRLAARSRDRVLQAFVADFPSWHIVEVIPAVTALAHTMLRRHELGAGDAIQLASALWLRATVIVTGVVAFDTRLVTAAKAEQFAIGIGRVRMPAS